MSVDGDTDVRALPFALGTDWGHAHLVGHVPGARHLNRFGFDGSLLVVGADGSFERHLSVVRDHFHVMRISRQGFVFHEGLPDLPREVTIARVFLLLICRHGAFGPISCIHLRVVWGRLRGRGDRDHRTDASENYRVNGPPKTVLMHTLPPLDGRHLL